MSKWMPTSPGQSFAIYMDISSSIYRCTPSSRPLQSSLPLSSPYLVQSNMPRSEPENADPNSPPLNRKRPGALMYPAKKRP